MADKITKIKKPQAPEYSYSDITDAPVVPKLYTETGDNTDGAIDQNTMSDILDTKANYDALDPVAFSGSWNDIKDRPYNPEVPDKLSAFINDVHYVTADTTDLTNYISLEQLAPVATSGNYNDLSNKPSQIKLYTSTGTNTDGAMDQNSITTVLNTKASTGDLSSLASSLSSAIGTVSGAKQDRLTPDRGITITSNRIATTAAIINVTNVDPGEGATLAANSFIAVYRED